jgi:penicillin-binding protein 1C
VCAAAAIFLLAEIFVMPFPARMLDQSRAASLVMTDRNGDPLREKLYAGEKQTLWVPLEEISPHAVNASIAVEDARFYRHGGVDFHAIGRAVWQNLSARRVVSGGSTITQQLVRNLRPANRNIFNKAVEALLAIQLERRLTKKEILYQYLNRIPYGNGAYGIEAAARLYFDKRAADLDAAEAALLAALPRAPSYYNPYRNFGRAKKRADFILGLMRRKNYISESEWKRARSESVRVVKTRSPFLAPHFTQYVLSSAGPEILDNANVIRTTIDLDLQKSVEGIVKKHIESLTDKQVTNAAVIVLKNSTGEILAMVGSENYFNRGNEGMNNGALARRQPGSALKPFTYSVALENGFTAASLLPDVERHFSTPDGDYMPQNYDLKYHGPVRIRVALANSLNVPAVYMAYRLGPSLLLQFLKKLGITTLDKDAANYGVGITLGNGEVSLLELTHAYTVFPNLGALRPLRSIISYDTPGGKNVKAAEDGGRRRIFAPQTAYIISDIISDRNARAPTFGISSPLTLPFRVGAKTGTSSNFRDNWTLGFTKEITVGVWCGNFSGDPMQNISGITGAGPIFRDTMRTVMKKYPKTWMARPGRLIERRVCPVSGKQAGPHCTGEVTELFVRGSEPAEKCDMHREEAIDTRNGLLAGAGCPREFVMKKVFLYYPPQYSEWAQNEGLEQPPAEYSPLCGGGTHVGRRAKITILFPDDGDSFAIDPTVPENFRSIVLRAAPPSGVNSVRWLVDGHRIAETGRPYSALWRIRKGKHRIAAEADGAKGDAVTITVK